MIIVITLDFYISLRKSFANILNYATKILKLFINIFISTIIVIDLCLKHVTSSEVIIYERFKTIDFLTNLLDEYQNLFIDQNQTMNILKKK